MTQTRQKSIVIGVLIWQHMANGAIMGHNVIVAASARDEQLSLHLHFSCPRWKTRQNN